jgi:hypothetical protein
VLPLSINPISYLVNFYFEGLLKIQPHHNIQLSDILHNDTQHNDNEHNSKRRHSV